MAPIPIPPREDDPFDGLVLDQSFVQAAPIREDRLAATDRRTRTAAPIDRLAIVRARVDASAAPAITRRSLGLTALATATLVAALAVAGPGWEYLSRAWSDTPSAATTRDGHRTTLVVDPFLRAPGTPSTDVPPVDAGLPGDDGPVLVDGQLQDPFRDPFSG